MSRVTCRWNELRVLRVRAAASMTSCATLAWLPDAISPPLSRSALLHYLALAPCLFVPSRLTLYPLKNGLKRILTMAYRSAHPAVKCMVHQLRCVPSWHTLHLAYLEHRPTLIATECTLTKEPMHAFSNFVGPAFTSAFI